MLLLAHSLPLASSFSSSFSLPSPSLYTSSSPFASNSSSAATTTITARPTSSPVSVLNSTQLLSTLSHRTLLLVPKSLLLLLSLLLRLPPLFPLQLLPVLYISSSEESLLESRAGSSNRRFYSLFGGSFSCLSCCHLRHDLFGRHQKIATIFEARTCSVE